MSVIMSSLLWTPIDTEFPDARVDYWVNVFISEPTMIAIQLLNYFSIYFTTEPCIYFVMKIFIQGEDPYSAH